MRYHRRRRRRGRRRRRLRRRRRCRRRAVCRMAMGLPTGMAMGARVQIGRLDAS